MRKMILRSMQLWWKYNEKPSSTFDSYQRGFFFWASQIMFLSRAKKLNIIMEGLARSRIGKQHQQRAPTAGDLKDIVKESLRWKMPTPAVNATIASANSKSTSSSQQTIQHQQSSSSVSSPSFPLHKLSASKTPTSSPITTTNENTPDTDSTTTTTTPSIAAREIWYNDPVLLAEQIEIQIARASSSVKLDSVLQVLYRHLGAGTPEVYGRVINALFEKGEQSRAWSAYRKVIKGEKCAFSMSHFTTLTTFLPLLLLIIISTYSSKDVIIQQKTYSSNHYPVDEQLCQQGSVTKEQPSSSNKNTNGSCRVLGSDPR